MRILLDTSSTARYEDDKVLSDNLANLKELFKKSGINIVNNADYGENLLKHVLDNTVDFLVTENRSIHKEAKDHGIDDRVMHVDEALDALKNYLSEGSSSTSHTPAPLKEVPVISLNLDDPIFESLKKEYPEFPEWFRKIAKEGRKCLVYYCNNNSIGALLIYKLEDEAVNCDTPLPKKKRLKISTMKVTHTGYKIGELFIKSAIDVALKNDIYEMYLTHFTKDEDRLVELICEYGFYKICANARGEDVFLKKLVLEEKNNIKYKYSPIDISKKFYPSFYDGEKVKKFVVPIRPEFHRRLFTDFPDSQRIIQNYTGEFIIEGNTIKKAYLSHTPNRKVEAGDILLFYRSEDLKSITTVGVAERVFTGLKDADDILKYVAKRTVYNRAEIEDMISKRPISLILFRHHFHLKNPVELKSLKEYGIFPRSVVEINHDTYIEIKRIGEIDERFTIN